MGAASIIPSLAYDYPWRLDTRKRNHPSGGVPAQLISNLRRASVHWTRGDKCLAHIYLAHAGLPEVDEATAAPLALADEALAKGIAPRALGQQRNFFPPFRIFYLQAVVEARQLACHRE
jgi:hypothetical protein